MAQVYQYKYDQPFLLESGVSLPGFHLGYSTFGKMNAAKDNVIWVFHALTANSDPEEWWPGLLGEGKIFDPNHYFIICVNIPTSCYGSLSPLDTNPLTGAPYFHDFPLFTTRDMIRSYERLRLHLGIEKIYLGIGGSMGGQQLLEWAIEDPDVFQHIIPIATNAVFSPWGTAFNASQRMAIESDPTWGNNTPEAGLQGLKTARSIALISYRNYDTYRIAQTGPTADSRHLPVDQQVFHAETYQKYQGEKLARRFNAYSYYNLSRSMDVHDVGRGRGGAKQALGAIKAHTLVIGIATDLLFPPVEQQFIAAHVPNAQVIIIDSLYGHDGFLLEFETIGNSIHHFLQDSPIQPRHQLKNIY